MALPKLVRMFAIATILLTVWLIYLVSRAPSKLEFSYNLSGEWREPNLNLIDEPPEPLHRVKDDNYSPTNTNSDRINATLLSLVRNSEVEPLLQSIRDLEATFNHKFNYPWTFFNDEPFTTAFKDAVSRETSANVSFHQIPSEHWDTPPWINTALYKESVQILEENHVNYANKLSYHQMCRWNSGLFPHHPALKDVQYYWRVEPNVHFFCDVDYDVFRFMRDHNKTYGFTIALYDAPATLPSLWPETQRFLADPDNAALVHPNGAMDWLKDSKHRPDWTKAASGFSTCHFWSNFEIANLDFWRSPAYQAYFDHLDRAGGFFYERWGDAPVHSIALGLFEDKERIHWFRDIGYQHIPYFNCPKRPEGKCNRCRTGVFTDGNPVLNKEDCRPSYLEHVGYGEWK